MSYEFDDFDRYQEFTVETASFGSDVAVVYPVLGLPGEAGEVTEKVKKALRKYGINALRTMPADEYFLLREEIKKELGDVLWYTAQVAKVFDLPFSDVVKGNVEKLLDRKARDVIVGEGDNR